MRVITRCDRAFIRCLHFRRPVQHRLFASIAAMSAIATNHTLQPSAKPKVLVITGPTAVGKTAISLTLAERLNGEIISADSVQVYKALDIGSDKISVAERRNIPHHLLDVFDPKDEFSAGQFYSLARAATADILSRGKTPIVVGGTGFYLRWYILGKPSTPPASKDSEAAAEAALAKAWADALQEKNQKKNSSSESLTEEEKWNAGVNLIKNLGDIESADRLRNESNNYYRLQRVVDILLQSPGKTLRDLNLNEAAPLDFDFRCYFLTRPRIELYRRIDSRVEDMVASGVIAETSRELLKKGLQANRNCSTRAIGYRQVLEYLDKAKTNTIIKNKNIAAPIIPLSESGIVELARNIQTASRQLCHKQLSWFRDDPLFKWIDASQGQKETVDQILELYKTPAHQGGCGAQFNGGRLSKEEEKLMKQYVTKFEKLVPGSDGIKNALTEAKEALRGHSSGNMSGENEGEEGLKSSLEEPVLKRSKK